MQPSIPKPPQAALLPLVRVAVLPIVSRNMGLKGGLRKGRLRADDEADTGGRGGSDQPPPKRIVACL